jgi:hypothetical protein
MFALTLQVNTSLIQKSEILNGPKSETFWESIQCSKITEHFGYQFFFIFYFFVFYSLIFELGWYNISVYSYPEILSTAFKRNKLVIYSITRKNYNIILNEWSQTQNSTEDMIPLTWNSIKINLICSGKKKACLGLKWWWVLTPRGMRKRLCSGMLYTWLGGCYTGEYLYQNTTVYLKWIHFIFCKLYLNKIYFKVKTDKWRSKSLKLGKRNGAVGSGEGWGIWRRYLQKE